MATSTNGGNRPATNLNCMTTIMSSDFPQLSDGPGWVVPNHAGQVTMVVQNCSPVDLHIQRGTKMGILENIHGIYIHPMYRKKIVEQINARKPDNLPKPLSPAEQKEFLPKLNLNIPEDEKKLYEQIILANHDVPKVLQEKIVQEAHGQLLTGHNGIARTRERIKESYFWPNIDAKHISSCQKCQKTKR
jgi:hypothetical protein